MANSSIVLQAETVLVHLVLSLKKGGRTKKRKFPPYFILLFVSEHLQEMEALDDGRLCIQAAILRDCMEDDPSAGWLPALGGALVRERHRTGPD